MFEDFLWFKQLPMINKEWCKEKDFNLIIYIIICSLFQELHLHELNLFTYKYKSKICLLLSILVPTKKNISV